MGIKIGDLSPMGGAVTGKGLFGKGLGAMNKAFGPMAGIMPRMAGAAQKRTARRAATAAEVAAMQKAEFDAKRAAAAGMRVRPMMGEVMMAEEAPAGTMMRKGGKVKKMRKGGKLPDLTGDGKVTRADVLKGRGVPGFKKGGSVSSASKRGDGCATKGKTKGRFV